MFFSLFALQNIKLLLGLGRPRGCELTPSPREGWRQIAPAQLCENPQAPPWEFRSPGPRSSASKYKAPTSSVPCQIQVPRPSDSSQKHSRLSSPHPALRAGPSSCPSSGFTDPFLWRSLSDHTFH
uniref:Uncharacterized protein n=1 Tax=Myotis myotis TaxID=51298 RepID=A0A7J8AL53_MYOMY|nr:hypothetical protein mMyoMyo1_007812 [Myotis myotis]